MEIADAAVLELNCSTDTRKPGADNEHIKRCLALLHGFGKREFRQGAAAFHIGGNLSEPAFHNGKQFRVGEAVKPLRVDLRQRPIGDIRRVKAIGNRLGNFAALFRLFVFNPAI